MHAHFGTVGRTIVVLLGKACYLFLVVVMADSNVVEKNVDKAAEHQGNSFI